MAGTWSTSSSPTIAAADDAFRHAYRHFADSGDITGQSLIVEDFASLALAAGESGARDPPVGRVAADPEDDRDRAGPGPDRLRWAGTPGATRCRPTRRPSGEPSSRPRVELDPRGALAYALDGTCRGRERSGGVRGHRPAAGTVRRSFAETATIDPATVILTAPTAAPARRAQCKLICAAATSGAARTTAATDRPGRGALDGLHGRRDDARPREDGDPEEPGPARPRDEGDAPLPRPRDRRAVLRPAHLHGLPDVLLGARARRDLPPRRRRRDRPAQAAEAHPGRDRIRPRLDDRAHRVHVRDQRRVADPVAPARPPPGRRRVRPAEPALRQVQGRLDDAPVDPGRGRSRPAPPLRGRRSTARSSCTASSSPPGSRARTPGSSSRTRPGRTWS